MTVRRALLVDAGDGPRPVTVALDGQAPAAALADALAASSGRGPGRWSLWCERLSADPLADGDVARLRDGDLVELGARGWRRPSPAALVARVAISGGAGAGTTWALAPGQYVIGRGVDAHLRLDDPGVSRAHATLDVGAEGRVRLADLQPLNPSLVDGVPVAGDVDLGPDAVIELGATTLRLLPAHREPAAATEHDAWLEVNRAPRPPRPVPPAPAPLPAPPDRPSPRRRSWAAIGAPLVTSVAAALVFASPALLLLAVLSPLAYLWQAVEDRRGERGDHAQLVALWRAQVARRADETRAAAAAWSADRRRALPDPAEVADRMGRRTAELWERRAGDADVLRLRLGSAEDRLALPAVVDGGDPALAEWAAGRLAEASVVHRAPVELDLRPGAVVGLCGDEHVVAGVARSLLLQVAGLHSPAEVQLAACVADAAPWAWLAFLPHTASATGAALAAGADAGELVERLVARVARAGTNPSGAAPALPVVVLVDGDAVGQADLDPVLRAGAAGGASVVWMARERRLLPNACTAVLDTSDPAAVQLSAPGGAELRALVPDVVPEAVALGAAAAVSALRDGTQPGARHLPAFLPLLDALGVADADAIRGRWAASVGLRAPLGCTAEGAFVVDLGRDGPHALVGGTTGSGKSELLQAFVAGLAAWNPPTRVTFLLIDYKGGAAFRECLDLPHTVGMVTDLDGQLAHRALVSLGAELRFREHLLARHGAKDLQHLERLDPAAAPPALVIVVDEFATLVSELPEFVDGVVNIAQRGRSLGIHLVLATQRPAGAVNDNIRANTNLRIALRMNDASDSDDVIGCAAAAALDRSAPGRAFARTGHGELAELQVAFAGARRPLPGAPGSVSVAPLGFGVPGSPAPTPTEGEGTSDLQVVVDGCRKAAADAGLGPARRPWLDPLPAFLSLDDVPDGPRPAVAVGLVDEPEEQRQAPLAWDPATDGSLLVWGAPGSGKTTLLRTLAAALARTSSPAEVQLHVVDYASRGLAALAELPHCATLVTSDDPERVERVFAHLEREVQRRQAAFGASSAADLVEHNAAVGPERRLPRLVVLLDGFAAFRAVFEEVDYGALLDRLPRLMADGRSLGVHLVLTGDGRTAFPLPVTSVACARWALRLGDVEDYGWIGFDARAVRAVPAEPGRVVLADGHLAQVAVVGDEPSAAGQGAELARLGPGLRRAHPRPQGAGVPALPVDVDAASLPPGEPLVAPIGIGLDGDVGLEVVTVDLRRGHLAVAGPPGSGRTAALVALARGLAGHAEVHLLAGFPPAAGPVAGRPVDDEVLDALDEARREGPGSTPLVVLVDDVDHVADAHLDRLEALVAAADDGRPVRLAVAGRTASLARAYSGLVAAVLAEGHLLLLEPGPAEADLAGLAGGRRPGRANPRGRATLVRDGRARPVQLARAASTPG